MPADLQRVRPLGYMNISVLKKGMPDDSAAVHVVFHNRYIILLTLFNNKIYNMLCQNYPVNKA